MQVSHDSPGPPRERQHHACMCSSSLETWNSRPRAASGINFLLIVWFCNDYFPSPSGARLVLGSGNRLILMAWAGDKRLRSHSTTFLPQPVPYHDLCSANRCLTYGDLQRMSPVITKYLNINLVWLVLGCPGKPRGVLSIGLRDFFHLYILKAERHSHSIRYPSYHMGTRVPR